MESGNRFIYFVFLPKLKSDAAWANAELKPNFVILNWYEAGAFLRQSLSFTGIILSLAVAFFLIFFLRYLAFHYRLILPAGIRNRPEPRFWIIAGGACAVAGIAYCFPVFHNIVLLHFSLVAIGAMMLHRLLLWEKPGARENPHPIRKSHVVILILILAGAFWMRAYKADWGFPMLLHTDEYAITTFPPEMAVHNSLNPIDFERPNHPSIYLNSILYGVASQLHYHRPLPEISRIAVAVLGVLSVLLAFAIGAEFHPRFGLFAALLFALFPQYIEHSHYATPDVSLTLLLEGVILFCIRYVKNPKTANLLYACACAALASGEKYPGLLTLFGIALMVWIVHRRDSGKVLLMLARACLAYPVFLFFAAPFVVLKPHLVLLNLISESRPAHPGQDGLGFFGNAAYYVHAYASSSSLILAVFCALGAAVFFRRHRTAAIPVLFGLGYWMVMSDLPLHWERWDLPMVVTPLLLSAFGMHWLWECSRLRPGYQRFAGRLVLALLAAAASLNLFFKDLIVLSDLEATDTRLTAIERFKELGVNDTNSLSGHYTPLYPNWRRGFDFVISFHDPEIMKGRKYAVVSSYYYERFFREENKYPNETRFYSELFSRPLVLELKPVSIREKFSSFIDFRNLARAIPFLKHYPEYHAGLSRGPEIRVYHLNDADTPREKS
jgi:hypothetical protein